MTSATPWLYYRFFVRPNFLDFQRTSHDIRLGFNAAVAAFEQANIFHAYYKRTNSKILQWPTANDLCLELTKQEPSFQTVQSVANIYRRLHARGSQYDTVFPMSLRRVGSTRGVGVELDSSRTRVIVRGRDGSVTSLLDALESVVQELWPRILPHEYG